jgi:hypothetical protein
MAYRDDEISGIGGWLMFFLVTLGLFTPLGILFAVLARLYLGDLQTQLGALPGWPAYRVGETALGTAHLVLALFLTWRLVAIRQWSSVRVTIIGIWAMGIGVTLADLVLTVLVLGLNLNAVLGTETLSLARVVGYGTIWTAYLLRSERVANTYPRHGDEGQLAAVFD